MTKLTLSILTKLMVKFPGTTSAKAICSQSRFTPFVLVFTFCVWFVFVIVSLRTIARSIRKVMATNAKIFKFCSVSGHFTI